MDFLEAINQRHSVRQYMNKPIPEDIRKRLSEEVEKLNKEGDMHMQLFFDEPKCFDSLMSHYGKFSGVSDYLAVVGKKTPDLEVKAGYYAEPLVLLAQNLGLNSCWVGMTHGKSKAEIRKGEKQVILIALGYGKTKGVAHKSKPLEKLCSVKGEMPDWFRKGMEGAMLAPTAVNQQKFLISWDGEKLTAKVNGAGFFTKTDLGIVKRNFELLSGHRFDD